MKLNEFSVKDFRSITDAYKLSLGDYTVLVGPNNEGKSNVLRALGLGLSLLSRGRAVAAPGRNRTRLAYRDVERFNYDWLRDFPLSLQPTQPNGGTTLSLTFGLTAADYDAFYQTVGSRLQSDLRIRLVLGREEASFEVILRGRGKKFLQDRQALIATFIGERILVQYIPALRSADMAHEVVNELVQRELAVLESSEEYQKLLDEIEQLQKPVRDRLSAEISQTMRSFIPNLSSVDLIPDDLHVFGTFHQ